MPPFERKITPAPGSEWIPAEPVIIGRHHLDTNHHVNNAQYIEFAREAAETLPAGQLSGKKASPARLDAQFKKMALLGDTVFPFVHISEEGGGQGREITAELRDKEGECFAIVRFR